MVEAERVMAEPPLTGVRVLELAAIGPVPLAGMLLCGVSIAVSYGSTIAWQNRPGGCRRGADRSGHPR